MEIAERDGRPVPQGDLIAIARTELPSTAVEVPRGAGPVVVAHSETGHHHVVEEAGVRFFRDSGNDFRSYLMADVPPAGFAKGAFRDLIEVKHLKDNHTHETLGLRAPPGSTVVWEIRRQRESERKIVAD